MWKADVVGRGNRDQLLRGSEPLAVYSKQERQVAGRHLTSSTESPLILDTIVNIRPSVNRSF